MLKTNSFGKLFLSRVLALKMLRSKNLAIEIDDIVWQPQIFLDGRVLFHNTKIMIIAEKTKEILSNILILTFIRISKLRKNV